MNRIVKITEQQIRGISESNRRGNVDLGTYYLKILLVNGKGWIQTWFTGRRYSNERHGCFPLDAFEITPTYRNEKEVFLNMKYMFLEGSYSEECNKDLFLSNVYNEEDLPSWDSLDIQSLTAVRPDGSELVLYEK